MSNLENIKNRILEDARTASEEILRAAREEKQQLIDSRVSEARELEKQQLERAKRESATKKERIISSAQLKVRNRKLSAKQEVIDGVFQRAITVLNSMEKESFEEYLVNKIKSLDISGEENLILSKDFISKFEEEDDKDASSNIFLKMVKEKINNTTGTERLIKKINHELKRAGKNGEISINKEPGSFQGGFILERNGVQINNTFEALVNSMRDELEYEIAKILFE
ncbi:V-type ATP synthase subunit E [Alloiococcus sp. CFN-8]|uniref:V-type ATP synthase subunit E n=1 Tax=Alloiococcus sp. CFN-8 TaxID=3416081 RepID=UPI003CEE0455